MVCVTYNKDLQPRIRGSNKIGYCCFPECKSTAHLGKGVVIALQLGDTYKLFPVNNGTDKSNKWKEKLWLKKMGLDFYKLPVDPDDPTKRVDAYLCDGHFSASNFCAPRNLKTSAVPDILCPNPEPVYFRIVENIKNKLPLDAGIDLKFSLFTSVPTKFGVKVGQHCIANDTQNTDLRFMVPFNICCFCTNACENDGVNLLNKDMTECSDFGRVISGILSLTETKLLSPYACIVCANKVMSCFHRMVDINTEIMIASERVSPLLTIIDTPDQLPCQAQSCSVVLDNITEYNDHMFEHIVGYREKTEDDLKKGETSEIVKEEVRPFTPVSDHAYCAPILVPKLEPELEPTPKPEVINVLCDICGVELTDKKAFVDHMKKHKHKELNHRMTICPHCGKMLSTDAGMAEHVKRHDVNFIEPYSKKPRKSSYLTDTCRFYTCREPGCTLQFSTWQEKYTHVSKVHHKTIREKGYCYYCDFIGRRQNLKRHFMEKHPEKRVARCQDCNMDFFHENALIIHNSIKHVDLHKKYLEQKDLLLKSTISSSRRKHAESMNKRKKQVMPESGFEVEEFDSYIVRPTTAKPEKAIKKSKESSKSKQDEETARYIAQAVGRKRPAETPQSTVSKAISALAKPAGKRPGSSPKKVQQRSQYSNYSNSPKQPDVAEDDDLRLDATSVKDQQYDSGYRPTSNVKYVWRSGMEENENVDYMEQVSATEYMVIREEHLSYL